MQPLEDREERLAKAICNNLERSLKDLDPWVTERLRAAREQALALHPAYSTAYEDEIIGRGGSARLAQAGGHFWRTAIAILAMVTGIVFAYYWNAFDQSDANEEIDSALLADDLSPKAYLDPGFQAWLAHFVHSSVR
ncbi:MAG: DUF3619 family protein [Rhodocyclaceae bacterium]|nr:DUF3619 family protein [Rhodocyclaceae bacterium]